MGLQGLGASAHRVAGFALLARTEATELPSHCGDECYNICRTLLEACRKVIDSDGADRVEAVVERLGFTPLAPFAMALVKGSELFYANGLSGDGVDNARKLWADLRRHTAYTSQVHALPWAL